MGPMLKGSDVQRAELKHAISAALRSACGNLVSAAVLLDVHVATLRRYVDRLGLGRLLEQARGSAGAAIARKRRGKRTGRLGGRPRKPQPSAP